MGREARCPAGFEWVSDEDALLWAGASGECAYPACSRAQEPPCDEEWDCDDASSEDRPGATEITGNGDDEDCNGGEICYDDDDNDNYLDTTADTRVSVDTDCADAYDGTTSDLTTD